MQKIVLADDNISILEILKLQLEQQGYEVKAATNKSDLFWTLRNFNPDLVILDVFLDKDDGREICKKLITNYNLGKIPIILFSSNKYALSNFEEYGAVSFIEKPFDFGELNSLIRKALELKNRLPSKS